MSTDRYTIESLFDLVAPIAICGGADCCYEDKAVKAWKEIISRSGMIWENNGCTNPEKEFQHPLAAWNLRDNDDFNEIYNHFALPAYNILFEALVYKHGDNKWGDPTHDYYGAKGYKRPGDGERCLSLSGDSSGQFPWFETAALLIERIKSREKETTDRLVWRDQA